ncbi:hypothetical protein L211DRAFT_101710 [Terfezia boudieri ATCC MYA-4762]|uniref:Uncharacterized protein n=1 Tax=Terfezia boudieri ATCC MYA-4762 TaxID=1051890 RepID=A0A3N4LX08_9PEZI|nr:hypothetical protein L211DRAFT_101710 [Terfezia boudieri ATCC MYA-4762]
MSDSQAKTPAEQTLPVGSAPATHAGEGKNQKPQRTRKRKARTQSPCASSEKILDEFQSMDTHRPYVDSSEVLAGQLPQSKSNTPRTFQLPKAKRLKSQKCTSSYGLEILKNTHADILSEPCPIVAKVMMESFSGTRVVQDDNAMVRLTKAKDCLSQFDTDFLSELGNGDKIEG